MIQCEGRGKPPRQRGQRCNKRATMVRRVWRFGAEGEKPIVNHNIYLCEECSKGWDENAADAEGRSEA